MSRDPSLELISEHDTHEIALAVFGQSESIAHLNVHPVAELAPEVQLRVLLGDIRIERQPERAVAEAAKHFRAQLQLLRAPIFQATRLGPLAGTLGAFKERVVEAGRVSELPSARGEIDVVDP